MHAHGWFNSTSCLVIELIVEAIIPIRVHNGAKFEPIDESSNGNYVNGISPAAVSQDLRTYSLMERRW